MTTLHTRLFPNEPSAFDYFRSRLATLIPETGQVLDLGCGSNAEMARYRTAKRDVWGADLIVHPHLQYRNWFRRIDKTGRLPFADASMDVIASSWVLEHVKLPNRFLDEIHRVLKPGGHFLSISVNGLHYVTWMSRLMRLFPHTFTQRLIWWLYKRPQHDTFPVCYELNTDRQLRRAARKTGLELQSIRHMANVGYFSFSPLLCNVASLTDWLLEKLHPGLGRLYFMVHLAKPAQAESAIGSTRAA